MAKKFFQKWIPHPSKIKDDATLKYLGAWLHTPNLWHLNRRSVAGAFAVGLFTAFIPMFMQMLIAAVLAIIFRVNLPISVALVWLTNPLTFAPMFYAAYRIGAFMLGIDAPYTDFQVSLAWITTMLGKVWPPLLLGSLTLAAISATIGYFTIQFLWRWWVMRAWHKRCERRKLRLKEGLRKTFENDAKVVARSDINIESKL